MIKTFIKMDGTEEPYLPHKANGWGEWFSKNLIDIDWAGVVMDVVAEMPEKVHSQDFQQALINKLLDLETWSAYVAAGRLYSVLVRKKIYGTEGVPTLKVLHTRMRKDAVMVKMDYSTREYAQLEKMLRHDLDMDSPHFALHHIRSKYSLMNRVTKKEYETPQFTYMRMAMALAEHEPRDVRMTHVKNWYEMFSQRELSAPTPNYVNLGTKLRGFASCCLFASGDNGISLAVGDYIANVMTQKAAGIGVNLITRSLNDPVRNGLIKHQGKLPYIAAQGKAVRANTQNGRGGAISCYYNVYDPEVETIARLRNPKSTDDKKNRDLHYALMTNTFTAWLVANDKPMMTWNVFTAPDLHEAFYSADVGKFIDLYLKYEADPNFKKVYVNARKVVLTALNEGIETGTAYWANMSEINRHTPFLDPILSSNLCLEIVQPTAPYYSMADLHSSEDHGRGEIATCSLAAIVVNNIKTQERYQKVAYYALKMIDYCIDHSEYAFPHLEMTAKARRSAGVGIMGLATHMASKKLKYSSEEGLHEIHRIAEMHMYCLINASLEIADERGVAPWIHKTKWPQGWLPIDTYNRNVDGVVEGGFTNYQDWEPLRDRIVAKGGLAHSVLAAFMPGEASSKALGGANSVYAVRALTIIKTDNNSTIQWAAPYSDNPDYEYELAWEIPTRRQINSYAVIQKWTDGALSADLFRRILPGQEHIYSNELIDDWLYMNEVGQKTRYYHNVEIVASANLNGGVSAFSNTTEDAGCASGACSL